jgi:hypothetical protein
MKIKVFEITSKEDKVYQELLEQYNTNSEVQSLLDESILSEEMGEVEGDFRIIALLNQIIAPGYSGLLKAYLVKDVDNDIFVLGIFGDKDDYDEEGTMTYSLIKKVSKELWLAVEKALIENNLMKEADA